MLKNSNWFDLKPCTVNLDMKNYGKKNGKEEERDFWYVGIRIMRGL